MINKKYIKVINLVEELGTELVKGFGESKNIKHKNDSIYSVVTKYDYFAEEFLFTNLSKIFLDIGFRGEELGTREKSNKFWLVDPIDGTVFFTHSIPVCTTLLTLIENKEAIFSITYNFITKEMYVAEKDMGSWKNGKQIFVSKRKFKDSFIYFESKLDRKQDIDNYFKLRKNGNGIDSLISGYEYCKIAEGTFDGKIVTDSFCSDWDITAGTLLVKEAGGKVVNIGSKGFDYNNLNFIAGNKFVVEALISKKGLFPSAE